MTNTRPPVPVIDFERIGPRVGERFPDIELADQSGAPVNIHEHRGDRKGLIVFHRSASW